MHPGLLYIVELLWNHYFYMNDWACTPSKFRTVGSLACNFMYIYTIIPRLQVASRRCEDACAWMSGPLCAYRIDRRPDSTEEVAHKISISQIVRPRKGAISGRRRFPRNWSATNNGYKALSKNVSWVRCKRRGIALPTPRVIYAHAQPCAPFRSAPAKLSHSH